MGAGKTTIGLKLAENMHKTFIDSDHEIEQNTGATIPLIFDLEGEQGFRERETRVLSDLTQKNHIVLATGGGAVIKEENRKMLMQRGFVIYLQAPLDQLLERTAKDRNRPLLQTENPRKTLSDLLEKRELFYKEVADLIFETGKKPIRDIVSEITKMLENTPNKASA